MDTFADGYAMLVNIQFLRFLAALLVALYHVSDHVLASQQTLGILFYAGRAFGFAGVDVFFVISGFIMAWTTQEQAGPVNAWRFLRRRVARIYSGYWPFFFIALALFSWIAWPGLARAHLVPSFFLWPTALEHLLLGVSWTLIYEMGFYLLFTVLIAFGSNHQRRILLLAFLAVLAWSIYSQWVRGAYNPGALENMSLWELYGLFPYLLEFLAGALLAGFAARPGLRSASAFLLFGIALFVLGGWLNNALFDGKLLQGYFVIWRVGVFGPAALLVLAGLVGLEQNGIRIVPRFSRSAGGASYALYLSHTLILLLWWQFGLNRWAGGLSPALAQGAFIALTALMVLYSVAHYRWIERPLHGLFRRGLRI